MKKYFVMLVTMLSVTSALAAGEVTCKALSSAPGQGYEAVLAGPKAQLLVNGRKVADLVLDNSKTHTGGDQVSVYFYSQPRVNGYALLVKQGGLLGQTVVNVSRGGFAGFTTVARLTDCK